jgi:hypothetical protein
MHKEILRADAGFDPVEDHILTLARFFFQTFAIPESQSWIPGFDMAEEIFGEAEGPIIGTRLLAALRGVRYARRSVYYFNSPTCECCAAVVTEHERRFMAAFRGVREGHLGQARTELMMLCEGNDITQALGAMTRLVMMLPRVSCKPEAKAYV